MISRRLVTGFSTQMGGSIENSITPSSDAVFLYNLGDECTNLTGGWYQYYLYTSGRGTSTFELTADHIDIHCHITGLVSSGFWVSTRNNQNFSLFSKVCVDVQSTANDTNVYLNSVRVLQMDENTEVAVRMSSKITRGRFLILGDRIASGFQTELGDAASRSVFSYDISELQGTHRIAICTLCAQGGEVRTKIYRVWLEP